MWNISYYTSPLIITFLYRRGYFVAESITTFAKVSTGIGLLVVISLCMRGFGRSTSANYTKFVKALQNAKSNVSNADAKDKLREFDFEFSDWPIDFNVKDANGDGSKRYDVVLNSNRTKPFWISTLPCEIAAYIAIHTFGIRMLYPGTIRLLQSFLHPILVQGRTKLVEEENAKRFKLKTIDGNDIDTVFIDNRHYATDNKANGRTLVICSEGNAGFYEIGIMTTPIAAKFSVLGWNHPGFGGSTVSFENRIYFHEIQLNLVLFNSIGNTISTTRSKCNRCCNAICYSKAWLSTGKYFIIWMEYRWLFIISSSHSISRSERSGNKIKNNNNKMLKNAF